MKVSADDILQSILFEAAPLKTIRSQLPSDASERTLHRALARLADEGKILKEGKASATRYIATDAGRFLLPLDPGKNLETPQDERRALPFSADTADALADCRLFTQEELAELNAADALYRRKHSLLTPGIRAREEERLFIDFAWKSSAMEGSRYTLIEAETLLKDYIPSGRKSAEDARMILNHRNAMKRVLAHPENWEEISAAETVVLHGILTEGLNIASGIREQGVGLTGTNYRPLQTQGELLASLDRALSAVNRVRSPFQKALMLLLLISYIQPFEDGNKRCARVLANASLRSSGCCPLSFRKTSAGDYRAALLLFYETHSLAAFKKLFTDAFLFSAKEYG
jgi:Fic family protein